MKKTFIVLGVCLSAVIGGDNAWSMGPAVYPPIISAAWHGEAAEVEALIKAGADVNARWPYKRTTALMHAKSAEKARLLLSAGADLEATDEEGKTALHHADFTPDVTEALITAGANVNAQDDDGNTPLHIAQSWGSEETVRALRRGGADENLRNKAGQTVREKVKYDLRQQAHWRAIMNSSYGE